MKVVESFESVGNCKIYTRSVGQGPDVVALHGGPGAHHDYLLPYFDQLADGRTMRFYDQRGGGRSKVPREHRVTWTDHVDDLVALLDIWKLKSATLLGYSWGGLLALLFATAHSDRVERMALVSPAPITKELRSRFETRLGERMKSPEILEERRKLRESDLKERDPEAYRHRSFELAVAGYFFRLSAASDLTPFRITGRVQDSVWASLGDYDLTLQLSKLQIPSLVIHGRHDAIPLESSEKTAALLQAELEIFEESGHVPYVEETKRFRAVLNDFLPSVSRTDIERDSLP